MWQGCSGGDGLAHTFNFVGAHVSRKPALAFARDHRRPQLPSVSARPVLRPPDGYASQDFGAVDLQ